MKLQELIAELKNRREQSVRRSVPRAKPKRSSISKTLIFSMPNSLKVHSINVKLLKRSGAIGAGLVAGVVLFFSFSRVEMLTSRVSQTNSTLSMLKDSYLTLMSENKKLREKIQQMEEREQENKLRREAKVLAEHKAEQREAEAIRGVRGFLLRNIPNGRPLFGAIVSPFGSRFHPIFHRYRFHSGIDIHARVGTPVAATASGVVSKSGWQSGYGNVVVIDHSGGFQSVYAHLSRKSVRVGQHVNKGMVIARSGNTGTSTGPHLHYEVRYHGRPHNPANFVAWNGGNYNSIFKKERSIAWASLTTKTKQRAQKLALR